MAAIKSSFEPVIDARTRVLILGSLPGELSLARGQYYGNDRNHFWRLIGSVIGREAPDDYERRLDLLRAHGVGLWDVVRSAERAGSLDTAIRNHEPNALADLIARLPQLRAIGFNGGKAYAIGRRLLGDLTTPVLIPLPSSSPAYTLTFERKRDAWLALRGYLEP